MLALARMLLAHVLAFGLRAGSVRRDFVSRRKGIPQRYTFPGFAAASRPLLGPAFGRFNATFGSVEKASDLTLTLPDSRSTSLVAS